MTTKTRRAVLIGGLSAPLAMAPGAVFSSPAEKTGSLRALGGFIETYDREGAVCQDLVPKLCTVTSRHDPAFAEAFHSAATATAQAFKAVLAHPVKAMDEMETKARFLLRAAEFEYGMIERHELEILLRSCITERPMNN